MTTLVLVDADNVARWRQLPQDWVADPGDSGLAGAPRLEKRAKGVLVVAMAASTAELLQGRAEGGVEGWLERLKRGLLRRGTLELAIVLNMPQAADAALRRLMHHAPEETQTFDSVWTVSNDHGLSGGRAGPDRIRRVRRTLTRRGPREGRAGGLGSMPSGNLADLARLLDTRPAWSTLLSVSRQSVRGVARIWTKPGTPLEDEHPRTLDEAVALPGMPGTPGPPPAVAETLCGGVRFGDHTLRSWFSLPVLQALGEFHSLLSGRSIDSVRLLRQTWPDPIRPAIEVKFQLRRGHLNAEVATRCEDGLPEDWWLHRRGNRLVALSAIQTGLTREFAPASPWLVEAVPLSTRGRQDLVSVHSAITVKVDRAIPPGNVDCVATDSGSIAVYAIDGRIQPGELDLQRIQTRRGVTPRRLDRLPILVPR